MSSPIKIKIKNKIMNKNILLGLTSVGTLVAVAILISSPASAAFNQDNKTFARGNNFDQARFEEMNSIRADIQKAVENGDYTTWKSLVPENSPMVEVINEANFARFVEAHRLMSESKAIMEELGLNKMGRGFGSGNFRHHQFNQSPNTQ